MEEITLRSRTKTAAVAGIVLAAVSQLIGSYAYAPDVMQGSTAEWALRLVRDVSWWFAASVLIVSGIGLGSGRSPVRAFARLLVGAAALIVPIAVSLFMMLSMNELMDQQRREASRLNEIADAAMVDQDTPLPVRTAVTRARALETWMDSGARIEMIAANGETVMFNPTPSDIEQASKMKRTLLLADFGIRSARNGIAMNAAILLVSVVFGLILRKRVRPT